MTALRDSPATSRHKAKLILATNGDAFQQGCVALSWGQAKPHPPRSQVSGDAPRCTIHDPQRGPHRATASGSDMCPSHGVDPVPTMEVKVLIGF